MKQTHPQPKPTHSQKRLKPQAVWSHLTPQQQDTVRRTIELVCQDLARHLTTKEVLNDDP
jgi:hypothetical protein